jgi:sugar/nucleoside kinase (ribokinase family)
VSVDLVDAFPGSLLGVTPQGFLRQWDDDGLVTASEWPGADHVLGTADVVVLSFQDLGGDAAHLARYARMARLLVLTMGEDGAIVYREGRQERIPAYDVVEVDPTGAGDVFAAAFMIRYHETGDPLGAALYANCVASFCVEGIGATNLPTRERVDWRLQHGRLRR